MEGNEEPQQRSLGARIGIAALNLLTPGLGLLRLGRLRLGLAFACGGIAMILFLTLAAVVLPKPTPTSLLVVVIALFGFYSLLYVGSMITGWKQSRSKAGRAAWWSRWYVLLGLVFLVGLGGNGLVVNLLHRVYRPFYIPAESMEPTLSIGERFVADMRDRSLPRRGDIILLSVGEPIYIKRVAALPGDRIAMRGGFPVVNGVPATERQVGTVVVKDFNGTISARIFAERLPGEASEHRVLDLGESRTDDMAETVVPAGHLFVLGDNRDRSADSRVARDEGGVEMLPVSNIVGRPLFKTWTKWRWLGTPIE